MWELLAGSILAYFEITNGHRTKNKTLNLILPIIGLLLIILTIIFFKLYFPHPSLHTLPAIIGVCLIIWFSDSNGIVTRLLSIKLFVAIGLISYSLYLWHYPIFAFDRITDFNQGSSLNKLLLGIILIILSILSYYFIEQPFRNKKKNFKVILSIILIIISILVICNLNIIRKDGYKNRLPEIVEKTGPERPWLLLKNFEGKYCLDNINGCKFNTSSNKKIYIIGDSHMATLMFDLKDRVVKNNYQFITSTLVGCMFFPEFNLIVTKTKKKYYNNCDSDYFKKIKQTLSKDKNSIIIFGGRLPLYLSNYLFDNQEGGIEGKEAENKYLSVGKYETIQKSFKNEILELSKNNKIILVYPIPEVGWNPNKQFYNKWAKLGFSKNHNIINMLNITTSFAVYKNRTKSSFELLDSIKDKNIYRVYPHTLFCDTNIKNRCVTHDKKYIFYSDDNHPSLKGSEMINNLIIKEIEKIELKSN